MNYKFNVKMSLKHIHIHTKLNVKYGVNKTFNKKVQKKKSIKSKYDDMLWIQWFVLCFHILRWNWKKVQNIPLLVKFSKSELYCTSFRNFLDAPLSSNNEEVTLTVIAI